MANENTYGQQSNESYLELIEYALGKIDNSRYQYIKTKMDEFLDKELKFLTIDEFINENK